jgi:hypothetical protein
MIIHAQLPVPSFITDNQDTAAVEVRDESADNEEAVKVGCFMVCTAAAEIFS